MPERPSVLLLHDQLMDARIWGGFVDVVSVHARPIVLPVEPQRTFYPVPWLWAEYVEKQALAALDKGEKIDLVVATGWAAGGALSFAHGGVSRLALLLNPRPVPSLPRDGWQAALERAGPEVWEQVVTWFAYPVSQPVGAWVNELRAGVMGPATAACFLEFGAESLNLLPKESRRLAALVAGENLGRVLPVSFDEVYSRDPDADLDWWPDITRLPKRCAVAFSGPPDLYQSIRDLLRQEAPSLRTVDLNLGTLLPWLEDPDRVDGLVRRLLACER